MNEDVATKLETLPTPPIHAYPSLKLEVNPALALNGVVIVTLPSVYCKAS